MSRLSSRKGKRFLLFSACILLLTVVAWTAMNVEIEASREYSDDIIRSNVITVSNNENMLLKFSAIDGTCPYDNTIFTGDFRDRISYMKYSRGIFSSKVVLLTSVTQDEWQEKALVLLTDNDGTGIITQKLRYDDRVVLKSMVPLYADATCVSCHSSYIDGHIFGGREYNTDITDTEELLESRISSYTIIYTVVYLLLLISAVIIFITYCKMVETREKCMVDLQNYNDELIRKNIKIEQSDMLKTAFLRNISHEIRTPLNAIIGFSSLLKMHSITREKQEKFVDIIIAQGEKLTEIVEDVIEVSKIQTSQLVIRVNDFFINDITDNIICEAGKSNNGIEFIVEVDDYLKSNSIRTDKQKLKKIIDNIVCNSFKFTCEGYVKLLVRKEGDNIVIVVKDTGIGIASDKLSTIFDSFVTADIELSRKYQGTGLGLTISRGLVNALGGTISISSELNVGTIVTVTVPIKYKSS